MTQNRNLISGITEIVEKACKQESNYFGSGAWYHTQHVVKYARVLADKLGADREVVEIAAWLHDYASILDIKLYPEHHIHGAEKAEEILQKFNYPENKIELVKKCIISHRGSKPMDKNSPEELCVADADAMAHFDEVDGLLYLAFVKHKMGIKEGNDFLIGKLERSWAKMSPEAREIIKDRHEAVELLLTSES